jgi:hypothetical protein
MTPIIRPAIKGDIPLAGIDACKAGSGKGILANSTAMIATGRPASILAPPSTEEEWGKSLMAILMEGQTVICIDNVIGRLQSAKLDGVLTSQLSQGRVLGQSATVHVPNLATWIATGNNLQLGGDLARRSYWIRLDPKMSRPWMRQGFRHPNLIDWLQQMRMEFIGALLTLIRSWYASGQPLVSGLPAMATFSPWVNTIGSILAHVGVSGFLGNQIQHYEASDEVSTQWEIFLQAWYDKIGSNWVKTAEIVNLMNEQPRDQSIIQEQTKIDLAEVLPERLQMVFKEKPNSFVTRLGQELKKRVNECFGEKNLHVEQGKKCRAGATLWRVELGYAEVAEVAEVVLVNSHRENKNVYQKNNTYKEEWNRPLQSLQPLQSQEEKVSQTVLGSGSKPLEPGAGSTIETPATSASSQSTLSSSSSDDQSSQALASKRVVVLNNDRDVQIASSEKSGSEDEKWERFRICQR